jgi:hypothetical protein
MTLPKKKNRKTAKKLKAFRLTPDAVDQLATAAEDLGMSETVYVEQALREKFKRDRVVVKSISSSTTRKTM